MKIPIANNGRTIQLYNYQNANQSNIISTSSQWIRCIVTKNKNNCNNSSRSHSSNYYEHYCRWIIQLLRQKRGVYCLSNTTKIPIVYNSYGNSTNDIVWKVLSIVGIVSIVSSSSSISCIELQQQQEDSPQSSRGGGGDDDEHDESLQSTTDTATNTSPNQLPQPQPKPKRRSSMIGPWMDNIASVPCGSSVSPMTKHHHTTYHLHQLEGTTAPPTQTAATTTIQMQKQEDLTNSKENDNNKHIAEETNSYSSDETVFGKVLSAPRRYISRWGQHQQPHEHVAASSSQPTANMNTTTGNGNKSKSNSDNNSNEKSISAHSKMSCTPTATSNTNIHDEYPNFKRHREDFLLRKYLTPELYYQLKTQQQNAATTNSNNSSSCDTIDDIIKAGVALPYGGMDPMPHSSVAGIYIGYPESYHAYKDLLIPIIESYHYYGKKNHNTRIQQHTKKSLQRHETNLNPKQLVQKQLDEDGRYILYTRMRLARSVEGYPLPIKMDRTSRRQIERLLQDCCLDWMDGTATKNNNKNPGNSSNAGGYRSIMDMNNNEHEELIRRHVLFSNPDDFLSLAGFGNDWPDGRGLYCNNWNVLSIGEIPNVLIWCNAYDHYWIISHAKGGNIQQVFTQLSDTVHTLEVSLHKRNKKFVEDEKLGYLNSSPADIGTALRASVYIKLVRLGQLPGFHDILCKKLHLQARQQLYESDKQQSYYYNYNRNSSGQQQQRQQPRYTGIFHIANAESLGQSEVELINVMINGVAKCIELEKRLEQGETIDLNAIEI